MKTITVKKGNKQELLCNLEDINIILEEDSSLKIISIQDSPVKIKARRVSKIGRNAKLKVIDYWLSGSVDLISEDNLTGKGSEVKRIGIFFGSKNDEFESKVIVNHNAPQTKSYLITKGALDGESRSNICDTIAVKKGSKKSNGKQKTDILLLSDRAYADASPQLEINEEEVNCSHGASIGRVNPDKLFYLTSRGLTKNEAKKQIISAFFEPLLKEIRDENIICSLRSKVANKVGGVK